MPETPRVMLYVNDRAEGTILDSIDAAKLKAKRYIDEGAKVHIVVARWLQPLETLTFDEDSQDWASHIG